MAERVFPVNILVCHGPEHKVYEEIKVLVEKGAVYIDPVAKSGTNVFNDIYLDKVDVESTPLPINKFEHIYLVKCPYQLLLELEFGMTPRFPISLNAMMFRNFAKLLKSGGIVTIDNFGLIIFHIFDFPTIVGGFLREEYIDELTLFRKEFYKRENYYPSMSLNNIKRYTDQLLEPFKDHFKVISYPYYQVKKDEHTLIKYDSVPLVIEKK